MLRVPLPALLLLASASLLLAGTSLAVAEAHYVTPAGQATWEQSLDQRTPCSLATANARAQAGDTVYMLSGTYQTSIAPEHSGTSAPGGRIVYSSQPGGSVLIRDADHAILLEGRSYISVHGIHAFNCRQFLVIRQGHHNDIGHCHFEQNQTELVWMGSWVHDNSTYNRIHNSSFERFGWVDDGDDKGVLLDVGYDTSTTDASNGNVIEANHFAYGGHHALHICSANNVVRGNYLHNEAWMPCARPGGCGNRNAMVIGPMARRNLFEGNRFAYAGPPPDDNGANGLVVRAPDNIVRRNMAYANGAAGIALASMTVSVPTGNHIYANTIHHNGYSSAIDSFWTGGISFGNWGNGPMPGNVLVNNILHGNHQNQAITGYGEAGPQTLRTNWLDAGDPGFIDASLPETTMQADRPDYHLRPDSPCIDKGEFLTQVVSDTDSGTQFSVADAGYFYDGWQIPGERGDRIQLQGDARTARITTIDYETGRITVDRALTWTRGQGISLAYAGAAPDLGAHEHVPPPRNERLLFEEHFAVPGDRLPDGWWVEGGQQVWVEDGRLQVRANPEPGDVAGSKVCTVWYERVFDGDIRVEFDAHVVASEPGVNNINFFLLYSDPARQPLFDSRGARAAADYSDYHSLNGYIVTFLQDVSNVEQQWPDATPKARFRLRRCPGFQLLEQVYDYHCQQGITYHIAMTRRGTRLTYAVDGVVYLEADDPEPLDGGLIGLRTFRTQLWWDNITVTALD